MVQTAQFLTVVSRANNTSCQVYIISMKWVAPKYKERK